MLSLSRFMVLFAAISASAEAQTYTTSFSTTENPLSENGKWTNGGDVGLDWQNVRTTAGTPNKAYGTGVSYDYNDCIAVLSGFPANQSAEATVYLAAGYTPPSSHEIELLLRFQVSAHNARGYEINFWAGGSGVQVVRWNGRMGDWTELRNTGTGPQGLVTGDIVKAQMIGNTVTVFKNGTVISTVTDDTFKDGNPGMGFFIRPGGAPDKYCFTRYSASATDSSGVPAPDSSGVPPPDSSGSQGGGRHRHPRKLAVGSAGHLLNRIQFPNGSQYPVLLDGMLFDVTGRSLNAGAATSSLLR
jgi:hypothetical protein